MKNQKGVSLVEMLVVIGVMAIMMLAMTTMQTNQQKEMNYLTQKLDALDLEKLLIAALSDGSVCSYALINESPYSISSPATFDSTRIGGGAPPTINITNLRASANASAPVVVQSGSPLSSSSMLDVAAIRIESITSAGTADQYLADLVVQFSNARTVRPLKPVSLRMKINTAAASPANAKQVASCQYGESGAGTSKKGMRGIYEPLIGREITCNHRWGSATVIGWAKVDSSGDPWTRAYFSLGGDTGWRRGTTASVSGMQQTTAAWTIERGLSLQICKESCGEGGCSSSCSGCNQNWPVD